jgi:hypothetical protein
MRWPLALSVVLTCALLTSACLGDLSLLGAPCDTNDDCGAFICKIEEGAVKGVCAWDDGSGGIPSDDAANGKSDGDSTADAGNGGGGGNHCVSAIGQFDNPQGDEGGPQITITNAAWDPVYDGNCTATNAGTFAYDVFFEYDDFEGDARDDPAPGLFEFALPDSPPPGRDALITIEQPHSPSSGSYEWTVCVDDHPAALAGRYKDNNDNWSAVSCFTL